MSEVESTQDWLFRSVSKVWLIGVTCDPHGVFKVYEGNTRMLNPRHDLTVEGLILGGGGAIVSIDNGKEILDLSIDGGVYSLHAWFDGLIERVPIFDSKLSTRVVHGHFIIDGATKSLFSVP